MEFPDVLGALTSGKDRREALEMAEDALVAALGAHWKMEREIPLPSPVGEGERAVPLPPLAASKVALYRAMRERELTCAELAERLGISEDAFYKLIDPDYGSHLSQVERALRCLGKALVVEDLDGESAPPVRASGRSR